MNFLYFSQVLILDACVTGSLAILKGNLPALCVGPTRRPGHQNFPRFMVLQCFKTNVSILTSLSTQILFFRVETCGCPPKLRAAHLHSNLKKHSYVQTWNKYCQKKCWLLILGGFKDSHLRTSVFLWFMFLTGLIKGNTNHYVIIQEKHTFNFIFMCLFLN